jgi:sugar-specific transcriptional regulator TrmB
VDVKDALKKLDLTPNEATIYTYLYRNKQAYGPDIYGDCNLDKSSAYNALNRLIELDLVESDDKKRNQKFSLTSINNLHDLWKQHNKELLEVKTQISSMAKALKKYARKQYKNQNIDIFEGKDGYEKFLYDRLEGEHKIIKELSQTTLARNMVDDYFDIMDDFIKRRVEKGKKVRLLFDRDSETEILQHPEISNPATLKESRIVKAQLEIDAIMVTYGSKTGFYSSYKGQFLGVIINDHMIHNLLDSLFDSLWRRGRKI